MFVDRAQLSLYNISEFLLYASQSVSDLPLCPFVLLLSPSFFWTLSLLLSVWLCVYSPLCLSTLHASYFNQIDEPYY